MSSLELYKWYEYSKNNAQVIWFRFKSDLNGFAVLYDVGRDKWEYEGLGDYGYDFADGYREQSRKIPSKFLREIITQIFEEKI